MEENKNIQPDQPAENIPKVEQSEIPPSSGKIIAPDETVITKTKQDETPVPGGEEAVILEIKTTDQSQTKDNMEVHHHSHTNGKKNWKTYFWEFLKKQQG
jgi:hypothetical protein